MLNVASITIGKRLAALAVALASLSGAMHRTVEVFRVRAHSLEGQIPVAAVTAPQRYSCPIFVPKKGRTVTWIRRQAHGGKMDYG